MWTALNPNGNTIFLEEDQKLVRTVLKDAPSIHAHAMKYRTQLKEADDLLAHYRLELSCYHSKAYLRENNKFRLALTGFPDEYYDTKWDLIDAPRGWYPEAPGRIATIFSTAVMARNRKGSGVTRVFLHDVNQRVEKAFVEEFLCRKYLVKSVGRQEMMNEDLLAHLDSKDEAKAKANQMIPVPWMVGTSKSNDRYSRYCPKQSDHTNKPRETFGGGEFSGQLQRADPKISGCQTHQL
ncbi:Detected protein of confused Function [Hibiscus syriacus]|uniref:Detected protein of confused Function n=1 Tax=Hibiscus syriacus TaxID=106335 RepID=A0A6A2YS68_HIBSY|nr:Detected protein of confused Function [Hibiscus syriacus]